jgi:hypothetical protein
LSGEDRSREGGEMAKKTASQRRKKWRNGRFNTKGEKRTRDIDIKTKTAEQMDLGKREK